MKADAVFEGGGVKGIAFIGALKVMEEHGYTWEKVAGTSAGSIVAALLSAGYTSLELKPIFEEMDYLFFLQRKGLGRLPVIGPIIELVFHEGLFRADRLELFIEDLLRRKGIRTFGDLPPEKLRIVASDVTAGKMLVLPDDLPRYDIDPNDFPIAKAARMSSSIPFFFQPAHLQSEGQNHYIVDGALLSNYPVWLFDVPGKPQWPTIGFRLHDNKIETEATPIHGLFSFTRGLLTTMLDAHDRLYVEKASAVRTIFINTLGIRATQFQMPLELRQKLFTSGEESAQRFLGKWDFEEYVKVFRNTSPKHLV
ncbi:patatin-like phospholipase family protein [Brevibacillus centrosporus]|jgi:NTE family protein|uniref:NTE family protein n=1 Tax=Brevibacillus centrosporus TaxID=54910 RepID=A0A1I3U474_9BACL|nr:patatin-like phospholipase family protein [Brevibacillus centrosporus]MEC2132600.1 patatin-like phospholipase family protein [Brevibacillus centrosporus]MED4908698.1 patatin-like phospholipase family protein [Brevibacillus centrosporus]RNB69655.1 phospholipase [Brevibacillus centrosporus]SFJ77349.1 NTE family protein [Brevibacillus centrosporus]GED29575.1 phospholipase [Brevibacillus centrosporus]